MATFQAFAAGFVPSGTMALFMLFTTAKSTAEWKRVCANVFKMAKFLAIAAYPDLFCSIFWIKVWLFFVFSRTIGLIVFDIVVLNSSRLSFHTAIWRIICYGFCSSFPSNWHIEMSCRRDQMIKLSNIKYFFQISTINFFDTCVLSEVGRVRFRFEPITD